MHLMNHAAAGLGLMMALCAPAQVAAEARIYPYPGTNFCPAGLQPVTLGGVICCGQPNQNITYSQALAHPASKHRTVRNQRAEHSARAHCPEGAKGCSYD